MKTLFTALLLLPLPALASEATAALPYSGQSAGVSMRSLIPACADNQVVGVSGTRLVCKDGNTGKPCSTQILKGVLVDAPAGPTVYPRVLTPAKCSSQNWHALQGPGGQKSYTVDTGYGHAAACFNIDPATTTVPDGTVVDGLKTTASCQSVSHGNGENGGGGSSTVCSLNGVATRVGPYICVNGSLVQGSDMMPSQPW